jgi:ferritin
MTKSCSLKFALSLLQVLRTLKGLTYLNVHKMNKYFFLILFNIVLPRPGSTQNPPLVDYDWRTGTLNKPFPFDQTFIIRLMHIPSYDVINIDVREVSNLRKHVKDLNKVSGGNWQGITNEDLYKKLNPRFVYKLERNRDFTGDTATFLQLGLLRPNTDYVLNISAEALRSLNQPEKNALTTYLEGASIINELVRKLAKEAFSKEDMKTLDYLTTYVKNLNNTFSEAIHLYNPDYRFKDFTETELRRANAEILTTIANFSTTIVSLKKDLDKFYKEAEKKNGTIKIRDFSSDFKNIDLTNNLEGLDTFFRQWEADAKTAAINLEELRLKDKLDNFKTVLKDVRDITDQIVSKVGEQRVSFAATIGTTYFSGATENARTYLSFDAGYGANMGLRKGFSYWGINIYSRPIKREIPLKHFKGWDCIRTRVSALAGITFTSIESEPMRGGLIGNKAILLGVGVRALPWLKFNYARMIYNSIPANPLVSRRYLASDHFISVSIDTDVVEIFKAIFK